MELNRRAMLVHAGALAVAGVSERSTARAARKIPFGLADITVRRELAADYAGTLRRIAAMGYTHFGFRLADPARSRKEPSPWDKIRMIRDVGLKPGVTRFNPIDPDYDRQIGQAAEIGVQTIVMTAAPPFLAARQIGSTTRAAFDAWLPQLGLIGAKCRAAGLTFAYHNHAWDMIPLGGERPLDIIARSVSPRDLSFEIDLGWTWYGGVSPLEVLARLGRRVVSMHVKDIDRSRGTTSNELAVVVGNGEMGYPVMLPRIMKLTSALPYIEVDAPADGFTAAAAGARFMREHAQ